MARKQSPTLTEAELPIMDILWQKGHAVVTDVVAGLANSAVAYNTVLTTLRILERKGICSPYQRRPRVRLSSCSGTWRG